MYFSKRGRVVLLLHVQPGQVRLQEFGHADVDRGDLERLSLSGAGTLGGDAIHLLQFPFPPHQQSVERVAGIERRRHRLLWGLRRLLGAGNRGP